MDIDERIEYLENVIEDLASVDGEDKVDDNVLDISILRLKALLLELKIDRHIEIRKEIDENLKEVDENLKKFDELRKNKETEDLLNLRDVYISNPRPSYYYPFDSKR